MSDSIIAKKKLFPQDLCKHCNPWELGSPGSGPPADCSSGVCWESFKVVCFNGFVPSEAHVFQKRMPKITKTAKERGKGDLSRIYE